MRIPRSRPGSAASLPAGPAIAGIRLSLPGRRADGRAATRGAKPSPRSPAPRPPSRLPAPAARRAPSRARPVTVAAAPSPSRSHVLVPAARRAAPPGRRGCAGPLSHAPGAAPGRASRASPAPGLPGPPEPVLTGGRGAEGGAGRRLGRRMPRAGPGILDSQAAGPAPRTAEGEGRPRAETRGAASRWPPRSVHLRAPRPSKKYRGRLLRPRSRPAAYRRPAAAMTPRPRASATVSAARRRRSSRRLRLPSDVTASAHSPSRRAAAARTPGLSANARARGGAAARALGRGRRVPARVGPRRGTGRSSLSVLPVAIEWGSWRWALLSLHQCAGIRGRGRGLPAVGVGSTHRVSGVGTELLRHPGGLGTQLLGNRVASRCVPRPGDLRLSLLPGGALVKERK